MKRDLDLIRLLLLKLEIESPPPPGLDSYSEEVINYHWILLIEAGLIEGKTYILDDRREVPLVGRLTWQGHEFLDVSRDNTVWNNAKRFITQRCASISFSLLKDVVSNFANKHLYSAD